MFAEALKDQRLFFCCGRNYVREVSDGARMDFDQFR
jgi:hypothetical protein|tara:strand:+ start:138 stop:245 length:108 start_codon:yes stop_codon:yes gene_type:complete